MALRGEAHRPTYLNLRPVGPGSSETFDAEHSLFGVSVVQKTVSLRAVVPDAVVLLEPRLLKELDHSSIPGILEVQHDPQRNDCVTMVLEAVGEFDAGAVVLGREPALSVGETASVALAVLGAIDHLHTRGLMHRDIKPDNIRVSADRRHAWLIDFNMAGLMTNDGTVTGVATPFPWMAPEVVATGRYSVRSELYSLGVVLSEPLRGRQMLADQPDLSKVEKRLADGKRGFPDVHFRRWPPHVPDGLRRLLTKATSLRSDDRFGAAAEMRTAMGRLIYTDWAAAGEGRWTGTWPSTRHLSMRIDVEVTVATIQSGPNRGEHRATARYMPGLEWRRMKGLDDHVVPDDRALERFFADVDNRLASLRPTS